MPVRRVATSDAATATRLLDAGLELLAEQGVRGLTHRALEARSGVSHGVTTYYFGTREALLDALLEHLLMVDGVFLDPARETLDRMEAAAGAGAHRVSLDDLTELSEAGLASFFAAARPALARYELFLYAARRPHLQPTIARLRAGILDLTARYLRLLGAAQPQTGALMLVALVDGLLLHELSAPDPQRRAMATSYLLTATRAALELDASPADAAKATGADGRMSPDEPG